MAESETKISLSALRELPELVMRVALPHISATFTMTVLAPEIWMTCRFAQVIHEARELGYSVEQLRALLDKLCALDA